jgi:outer membrane receptor protein involved in Fe transport
MATPTSRIALYAPGHHHREELDLQPGRARRLLRRHHSAKQGEPRLGIAYNIKPTNTVLRVSYARTMETPFNENLVLSSLGCNDPVINAIFNDAVPGGPA